MSFTGVLYAQESGCGTAGDPSGEAAVCPDPNEVNVGSKDQEIPFIATSFTSMSKAFPSLRGEGTPSIPALLSELFFILIAIGAVLAILRIAMAGLKYMLSESFDTKSGAKKDLTNSVFGLVIMLAAVVVLEYINPTLTNLNVLGGLTKTPPPGESTTPDPNRNAQKMEELATIERCLCEGKAWHGDQKECVPKSSAVAFPPQIPPYCANYQPPSTRSGETTAPAVPGSDSGRVGTTPRTGRDAAAQEGTAAPSTDDAPRQ